MTALKNTIPFIATNTMPLTETLLASPEKYKVPDAAATAIEKDKRQQTRRKADKNGTILDVAKGLIYGERQKVYSHPIVNFTNIANLHNAYFQAISVRPDVAMGMELGVFQINKIDVAYLNILQKIARGATAQDHLDTVIDIAGYAGCIDRILNNK